MRNRVRELRIKAGWTVEQLAERAGLSTGQVSKIETSKRGWSVESIQKLAKALDCDVAELIDVRDVWQDVPLFGIVQAGGLVEPRPAGKKKSHAKAPLAFGGLLALAVSGEVLYPRYLDRDRIFCAKVSVDPATCIGRECLVQLEDGRSYLRVVHAGSSKGRYNLIAHNQAPELDCALISCRPVVYSGSANHNS